jgi:anti-anti-sigma regulatory factor
VSGERSGHDSSTYFSTAARTFRYSTGGLVVLEAAVRLVTCREAGVADVAAREAGVADVADPGDAVEAGHDERPSILDADVVIAGELCVLGAATLREAFDWAIGLGAQTVTVDLSDLELCTAAGVALLQATRERLGARGRTLRIRGAAGIVAKVLDICRVEHDAPQDPA